MCGRYSLTLSKEAIQSRFHLQDDFEFKPRYNVSPGQKMPIIFFDGVNKISNFLWGLIPKHSADSKGTQNLYQVKSENLINRSPLKTTFRTQRCLIVADGYYDWKKEGKLSVPYRFTLDDCTLFAMAGIWDSWENLSSGKIIHSFSIITKTAEKSISEISERMPAILPPELETPWIQNRLTDQELIAVLEKANGETLSYYKCHKAVNASTFDHPQCIEAAPKLYPGETYNLFEF